MESRAVISNFDCFDVASSIGDGHWRWPLIEKSHTLIFEGRKLRLLRDHFYHRRSSGRSMRQRFVFLQGELERARRLL